jgi:hypothetical protein
MRDCTSEQQRDMARKSAQRLSGKTAVKVTGHNGDEVPKAVNVQERGTRGKGREPRSGT